MNLGIYLKLRHLNKLPLLLLLSAFLSSCLPMQKETQCGSNEAFNATRRRCVPVVGSSTTSTVFIQSKTPENSYTASIIDSGITHSVAISDAYNYGYTVHWYEHYQDNGGNTVSVLVAINTSSYSFVPSAKSAGDYILEAILYDIDANEQLDSVNWNIKVSDLDNPTLINASPPVAAYSYSTASTSESLSIYIDNPNDLSGYYYIYVDGVQQGAPTLYTSSATVSQTIAPSSMTKGIHTVEVRIKETTSSPTIIDNYLWSINIVDPDMPIIDVANSIPPLVETVTVVDGVNYTSNGWLREDLTDMSTTNGLCILVDNYDKNVAIDAGDGSDIDVEFFVSGNSIGNAVRDTASDGTTGLGDNYFCLSEANIDAAQSYFNLSNPDVAESKSINVVTYKTGTSEILESLTWNVVVRPKNIRPVISIDGANTDPTLGCVATSAVYYTGCTITQSVNSQQDTVPVTYGAGAESSFYTDDANDIDNDAVLAISLDYDPDIVGEDDYRVYFKIKKSTDASYQDIDSTGGTTAISDYTYADCSYDESDTAATVDSTNKLWCNLRMDAFNNNGSVEPGNYIVTAYIEDFGDGLGFGTANKSSNLLTWEITVVEQQDTGYVEIAEYDNAATTADSWIQTGADCTAPAGVVDIGSDTVDEANTLTFCIQVRDYERDDFKISLEMTNGVLGGYSTLYSTDYQTKSDNAEWTIWSQQIEIPQWAVTADGTTTVKVTVQDNPDSTTTPICFTCATDTMTFNLNVDNVNPAPEFDDVVAGANNEIDMSGNGTIVFAGMPFTITTSGDIDGTTGSDVAYTDNSQYDGNIVSWKWMVSYDARATWEEIDGASGSSNSIPYLVWTPSPDITSGTAILRLCLADDGDNTFTSLSCNAAGAAANDSIREWENITIYNSNMLLAHDIGGTATYSAGNDMSQWYDATNERLYVAYTNGTNIIVEKLGLSVTNGSFETIHSIAIPTEDDLGSGGYTATAAYDLSIDGVEGQSIMISYGLVEITSNSPQFRVRRIDISKDTLNFNYCGFYNSNPSSPHDGCDSSPTKQLYVYQSGVQGDISDNTEISGWTDGSNAGTLSFSFTSDDPINDGTNYDLILKTSIGDQITFRYGATNDLANDVIGYCNTGCTDENTRAQALATAINTAAGDTECDLIPLEFFAESTPAGLVTIYGPPEFDYWDIDQKIAPVVGRINIRDSDGSWYVPYSDAATSLQLGLLKGDAATNAAGLAAGTAPSHTPLAGSNVMNQEIDNIYNSNLDSVYIATKNTNSNLDIFQVNVGAATPTISAAQTDVHTKGSYDSIENVRVSYGANDDIYVSSISTTTSGDRDLSLAVTDSTLSAASADISISAIGYEHYVEQIDKAHVSADPANAGEVIVALTTNNDNAVYPNNAYMIKLTNVTTAATSFNLHTVSYPALNDDSSAGSTLTNGAIWATDIFQFTGKSYDDQDSVAEDLDKYSLFFGFHEPGGSGNEIRSGFYNIEEESILATDDTGVGFFPAIIPAQ